MSGAGSIPSLDHWARLEPQLREHWKSCRECGLEEHTDATYAAVSDALKRYEATLSGNGENAERQAIMAAMRELFETLHRINAQADEALLETDERELLVPWIIDVAAASGLDPMEFADGDPTMEFREF